jgi:hypothetical protein
MKYRTQNWTILSTGTVREVLHKDLNYYYCINIDTSTFLHAIVTVHCILVQLKKIKYLVSQSFIILVHQDLVLGTFVSHLSAILPLTNLHHFLNYILIFGLMPFGWFICLTFFLIQEYHI